MERRGEVHQQKVQRDRLGRGDMEGNLEQPEPAALSYSNFPVVHASSSCLTRRALVAFESLGNRRGSPQSYAVV